MPYNGSGTFTLPAGNPVVTGTTISSVTTNSTNTDLANGLSNAVTRNGQSPPTANLPMGSFKLTGLALGTGTGESVNYDQVVLKTSSTGSEILPSGTTAQRDVSPVAGYMRFNTTTGYVEGYNGTAWQNISVSTSTTGSTILPAGTTAQRDVTPSAGYVRYNSTNTSFEGYNGTAWGSIGGGATGGGQDQVFYENSQIITTSYTLTAGKSAMSTGPITINSGAVVTVGSGQKWVVL